MSGETNRTDEKIESGKGELEQMTENDGQTSTGKTSTISSTGTEGSKKKSPPTWKSYVILLILIVVYISFNLLGGYIFRVIERKPEAGKRHWFQAYKEEFVGNHSTSLTLEDMEDFLAKLSTALDDDLDTFNGNESVYEDVWTLSNGFLLSFTIASTIGYGLVTPITPGGQVFCIIYALLSIPFTGLLAAKIGSLMAYFIKKAAAIIFKKNKGKHANIASILFTFGVGLLLYILIPAILLTFVSNEEGWTFIECLYCIFVTLTTIGFGDYVPDPESTGGIWAIIFILIWVVAGLAWFATIVNLIANALSKQASSFKKKVAKQQLSLKTLKSATATLGGNKKPRPKSLGSAENGESSHGVEKGNDPTKEDNRQWRNSSPSQSDEEMQNGLGSGKTDKNGTDSKPTDGGGANDESPQSSHRPEIDRVVRNESIASKSSSKHDEDVMLGPSGFLAVIMNNMEEYGDPEQPDAES